MSIIRTVITKTSCTKQEGYYTMVEGVYSFVGLRPARPCSDRARTSVFNPPRKLKSQSSSDGTQITVESVQMLPDWQKAALIVAVLYLVWRFGLKSA